MLVSRLSSADHALCANSLQLINSLMRDAVTNDVESEWSQFVKRLQELGVIKAVHVLMQGTALQDLAHPLLEFQSLTKVLLRKWREVPVELEKPEHRRALKGLHLASNPEKRVEKPAENGEDAGKRKHNPEKWRRLGFESESPSWDFQEMGYLGMMDLTDYVRKYQDEFQKMLLEESTKPFEQRCPVARASLSVTSILYEHFEVDKSDTEDAKSYLVLESRSNFDKVFKPPLLHWSKLHVAGLHAFFRLWKATGAAEEDLAKIVELVRILIESVVGGASRTKDVQEIEEELGEFEYERLRELQMELLELTYEDAWGQHLRQVRDELHHEALQFVKEQRIRCLLQGAWFPNEQGHKPEGVKQDPKRLAPGQYRYVQLSHNRRFLHYADFESMDHTPELESLPDKSMKSLFLFPTIQADTNPTPQSTSPSSPPSSPTSPPPPMTPPAQQSKPSPNNPPPQRSPSTATSTPPAPPQTATRPTSAPPAAPAPNANTSSSSSTLNLIASRQNGLMACSCFSTSSPSPLIRINWLI